MLHRNNQMSHAETRRTRRIWEAYGNHMVLQLQRFYQMPSRRLSLNIALIVIGFVSMVSQILLIRELVGVFYGNELCLGIIFACWFFWMAAGSLGADRVSKSTGIGSQAFVFSQIIVSLLLPLIIILIKTIRIFLHVPVGELLGYHIMIISIPLLLAPLGMVIGAQFVLGCRFYTQVMRAEAREKETDGECQVAASKVYFYDAIGDTLGGFAFGYIFVNFFNSLETAFYTGIINLFCAIMLIIIYNCKIFLRVICIICLLVNVYGIFAADELMSYTASLNWKGFSIVKTASSRYGDLTVVKADNLYNFYHDGVLVFTSPQQLDSEELIHFPLLQTPQVRQILILGGAVAGGLREALKYKGAEIYYVELDPTLIKISKGCIPQEDLDSLDNPRVKNIYGDGRLFVKRWKGKPFDALIVNIGSPSTAERNRFYTLEFFEEVKRILKPQGVISLSIRSNEDYLGENMLQFNGCIYHTLKQVFPHIILVPGDKLTMIASYGGTGTKQTQVTAGSGYLSVEPHILAERLRQRGIKTRFVNEHYLPYRFYPERMEYLRENLDRVVPRINHDLRPVCYYFDMALWGEEFSQGTERLFRILFDIKPWQFLSGIILSGAILCFLFRKRRIYIPAGVFISSCGGMVLEIVLIIGFQILFGYIYHLVGIIIAGFMVGIAGGIWSMNSRIDKIKNRVLVYSLLQTTMAMYLFLTPVIFFKLRAISNESLIQGFIPVLFPILTALAGVLIGLIFPIANRIYSESTKHSDRVPEAAMPIGGMIMYAMDMIGACAGSLIAAVLTIPVFGIFWTCVIFGIFNLLMGIATMIAAPQGSVPARASDK
ncbi:hypothetical protein KKG56_09830 [bacterium]|nr:hypothetical protein [bacterium]